MQRTPVFRHGVVAAAALVVAVTAVAAAQAAAGRSTAVTTIQIGGVPSLNYMAAYIADARGYFANRNIKVEFPNISSINVPVITGDIQMAFAGSDSAFVTAAQGKPTPILAILNQRNNLALLVRKDVATPDMNRPYPLSVRALPKGVVIGTTNRTSGAETFLQSILGGAGLKEGTDYTIVSLGTGANIIAALAAGRVDAGISFPPFTALGASQGMVPIVQEGKGQGPSSLTARYGAALIANKPWVDSHTAVVKQFLAALMDGMNFLRSYTKNKAALTDIGVKYTGISDTASVQNSLPEVAKISSPEVNCGRLSLQAKLLISIGSISVLPPCSDIAFLNLVPKRLKTPLG